VTLIAALIKGGVADLALQIPSVDIMGHGLAGTLESVSMAIQAGDLGDQWISVLVRGLGPVKFLGTVAAKAIHSCFREMDIRRLPFMSPIEFG
jgi:hypothetical protein